MISLNYNVSLKKRYLYIHFDHFLNRYMTSDTQHLLLNKFRRHSVTSAIFLVLPPDYACYATLRNANAKVIDCSKVGDENWNSKSFTCSMNNFHSLNMDFLCSLKMNKDLPMQPLNLLVHSIIFLLRVHG